MDGMGCRNDGGGGRGGAPFGSAAVRQTKRVRLAASYVPKPRPPVLFPPTARSRMDGARLRQSAR